MKSFKMASNLRNIKSVHIILSQVKVNFVRYAIKLNFLFAEEKLLLEFFGVGCLFYLFIYVCIYVFI